MSKHTPGRWVLTDTHRVIAEDGSLLATAWFPRRMPDEDDRLPGESWLASRDRLSPIREQVQNELNANARLISAAPEMLSALWRALDLIETHIKMVEIYGGDLPSADEAQDVVRDAIAKATGEQP